MISLRTSSLLLFTCALIHLGEVAESAVNPFLDSSLPPCRAGAWGDLKCVPVTIAPSDDVVQELLPDYPLHNAWYFPNMTPKGLASTFKSLGLNDESQKLALTAVPDKRAKGIKLTPPPRLIEALSRTQRSFLYDRLAEFPLNTEQVNAFRFPGNDVERWIKSTNLPFSVANLIRKYSYLDNNTLFFSDLSIALPALSSDREKMLLLKALGRQHTYLVKLVIDSKSKPKELAQYWGVGRRKKDVLPLISSIKETGERHSIDISHLLPNFSRKLIYTYPSLTDHKLMGKLDCFWTALNFFSQSEDYSLLSGRRVIEAIKRQYVPIEEPPRLGDVLVYSNPERGPFHAAVYVAGGIVFTKNGTRISAPWIYSTLAEMERYYSEYEKVSVSIFRKKEFIQTDPAS